MDNRPIGMFDSGVGGLTVYKEIRRKYKYGHVSNQWISLIPMWKCAKITYRYCLSLLSTPTNSNLYSLVVKCINNFEWISFNSWYCNHKLFESNEWLNSLIKSTQSSSLNPLYSTTSVSILFKFLMMNFVVWTQMMQVIL